MRTETDTVTFVITQCLSLYSTQLTLTEEEHKYTFIVRLYVYLDLLVGQTNCWTCEAGNTVYNSKKGKSKRIGRMIKVHANDRTEIKTAIVGDIIASVGLKDTTTGKTV